MGGELTSKRPRGGERDDDVIPFTDSDVVGVYNPNNDAIIIDMMILKYPVKKIIVDSRSSANIFFMMPFLG